MNLFIIIIVVVLVVILIYNIDKSNDQKRIEEQIEQDALNRKHLELYVTRKNLFQLYNDYLYRNLELVITINDNNVFKNKLSQDFPNYGNGVYGDGILRDFIRFGLLKTNSQNKFILGKTFQIISIAYENFNLFLDDIKKTELKIKYSAGGYHHSYGDEMTSTIIYTKWDATETYYGGERTLYFGLSSGGHELQYFERRHNITTDENEMYLFVELLEKTNSGNKYLYYNIKKLRKDVSLIDYQKFFHKELEHCKQIAF